MSHDMHDKLSSLDYRGNRVGCLVLRYPGFTRPSRVGIIICFSVKQDSGFLCLEIDQIPWVSEGAPLSNIHQSYNLLVLDLLPLCGRCRRCRDRRGSTRVRSFSHLIVWLMFYGYEE
jgi:hypothetical protein